MNNKINTWLLFFEKCGARRRSFSIITGLRFFFFPWKLHGCFPFGSGKISKISQQTVPSGELTVCYWKWPFIVDFPIKNGGSFHCYVSSPEYTRLVKAPLPITAWRCRMPWMPLGRSGSGDALRWGQIWVYWLTFLEANDQYS